LLNKLNEVARQKQTPSPNLNRKNFRNFEGEMEDYEPVEEEEEEKEPDEYEEQKERETTNGKLSGYRTTKQSAENNF